MPEDSPTPDDLPSIIAAANSSDNSTDSIAKATNPGRYGHLRAHRFKPGTSGNPSGRPKKGPITDSLAMLVERLVPREMLEKAGLKGSKMLPKKPTLSDLMAYAMYQQVMKGNVNAFREISNRVEGRNPAIVNLQTTDKLGELQRALMAGPMEPGTSHPPQQEDDDDTEDDD